MSSFHRPQTPQSQHTGGYARINRHLYPNYNTGQTSSQNMEGLGQAPMVKPVNPFVTNPHGHPSYAPAKLGSKGGDNKSNKQPKPPDKPLMPYMRYSRKVSRLVWDSVKANNPDLKLWEIGKIIGQMWRELSDDQKQEYIDEYENEKLQYIDALKAYHNSPAYLSWVAAKGKVDVDVEPEEPEKNSRRNKAPPQREVTDQRIVSAIQANEEEDDLEDCYSVKNVSAARYYRNHCLINEIFSDAVVPDVRTIINESRMVVLKRQVRSLTTHQVKLENELQQIEEKHRTKKMRFSESSEQFYADLNKLCENKPQITDEVFNQMVIKAKEELIDKQKNTSEQASSAQQHSNIQSSSQHIHEADKEGTQKNEEASGRAEDDEKAS